MKRLFFLLVLGLLAAGCSKISAPGTAEPHAKLTVGMELNFPPFEMKDPSGTPTGVSVEMATALGHFLQREIQIEDMPFDALIPSLKIGKIDLVISSMTATTERAKSIDFSDPYLDTGIAILTGPQTGINSIVEVDQPGRNVAVKKGTTSHIYAIEHFKNAHLLVFDHDNTAALEVVQGKADAFIYDQMSIFQYARKNPGTTKAILQPFQKESWAIGLRKGNEPLRKEVNSFLADFKARKGFEALGDKYLGEDKKAFEEMGFPFYF